MDEYVLLVLADSNLPTGSFVASAGLESYNTHGFLPPPHSAALLAFIHDSLHSYARSALPVVSDAHRLVAPLSAAPPEPVDPLAALISLDAFYESITLSHVARRASSSQGVALLTLYSKALAPPDTHPAASLVDQLKLAVRRGDTPGHLPLCWGVLTGALHLSLDRAQHLALFLHARSILSAAVRMNTIGPYLAQQLLLRDVRPVIDAFVTRCGGISTAILMDSSRDRENTDELPLNGPANTWPLGEILAMRHDLQHSRMFNS
ncbi:UreF-domain-containing protein [Boletus coccyginus]|nr:UreF-domain-containing protein [Boletus coccyginus]